MSPYGWFCSKLAHWCSSQGRSIWGGVKCGTINGAAGVGPLQDFREFMGACDLLHRPLVDGECYVQRADDTDQLIAALMVVGTCLSEDQLSHARVAGRVLHVAGVGITCSEHDALEWREELLLKSLKRMPEMREIVPARIGTPN